MIRAINGFFHLHRSYSRLLLLSSILLFFSHPGASAYSERSFLVNLRSASIFIDARNARLTNIIKSVFAEAGLSAGTAPSALRNILIVAAGDDVIIGGQFNPSYMQDASPQLSSAILSLPYDRDTCNFDALSLAGGGSLSLVVLDTGRISTPFATRCIAISIMAFLGKDTEVLRLTSDREMIEAVVNALEEASE